MHHCHNIIAAGKAVLNFMSLIRHQSWFQIWVLLIFLHANYNLFLRQNSWSVTKGHICKYNDRTSKGDLSCSLSLTSYSVSNTCVYWSVGSLLPWKPLCALIPTPLCVCVWRGRERARALNWFCNSARQVVSVSGAPFVLSFTLSLLI